jgi:hypothetical protein
LRRRLMELHLTLLTLPCRQTLTFALFLLTWSLGDQCRVRPSARFA